MAIMPNNKTKIPNACSSQENGDVQPTLTWPVADSATLPEDRALNSFLPALEIGPKAQHAVAVAVLAVGLYATRGGACQVQRQARQFTNRSEGPFDASARVDLGTVGQ